MSAGETVTIERARVELSDVVSRVQYAGERVIVTRRGKPAAAIVPLEDLEMLRRIEDELDAEAIREALAEARAGKARPWSEVREGLRGEQAE
ncbi:MAG: type II toxin-antitoxin system Phd/YefM family antitoxin [Chloroflexota bacterium]